MNTLKIYSIENVSHDEGCPGSGLPFFAFSDEEAIEIVKKACKGVDPQVAKGHFLVRIGEFDPFNHMQFITGIPTEGVKACIELCSLDEEVSDEGSEV